MPRLQSLTSLLRPLAAPRAIAYQPHFRFSTATSWQAQQPPATSAAQITTPSLPPNASSEHPTSPKNAQRAADLASAEALTEGDSAQPPEPKPTLPSKHLRADVKPTKAQTSKPTQADAVAPSASTPPPTPPNTESGLKSDKSRKPRVTRAPKLELPPPKYHVSRSATKNLPIYTDYKRGGNLHQTIVRKITGDLSALRDELRVFLNKKNEDVKINALTQHVVVKGHHTAQIADFLKARGM
ncbi:hypothetical protein EJ02DRAFT_366846 [Clathrospora elynae]|uniref:Large ribosomal subunit protein mL49 n=1 Tax=Clathrospora elynae TaxID=706981 RepID=A0A6A5T468_9PLEO|nr:hypothetical protein EJ02DRAFT_366846 [Clathrospora elynae]